MNSSADPPRLTSLNTDNDPSRLSTPISDGAAMSAIFTFPNRILFGAGTRASLAGELAQLGVRRPLVVTDAGLEASGLVAEVVDGGGLDRARTVIFRDVQANPTEGDVLGGLDRYRA